VSAQELEALGLGMTISLALLASTIFLLGTYLSQWKRGVTRAKLEPYVALIISLVCSSIAMGFLAFYLPRFTVKLALQAFVVVSLFPNFVILLILALTYVHEAYRGVDPFR
jgi:cation transporter-like permease